MFHAIFLEMIRIMIISFLIVHEPLARVKVEPADLLFCKSSRFHIFMDLYPREEIFFFVDGALIKRRIFSHGAIHS